MSRRCLIVTAARPAATGAPDWRRFAMVADYYRQAGLETVGLCLAPEDARGAARAAILRGRVDAPAFAAPDEGDAAAVALEARYGFDVVHAPDSSLGRTTVFLEPDRSRRVGGLRMERADLARTSRRSRRGRSA